MKNIIESLEITHQRLNRFLPELKRPYFNNIKIEKIRAAMIYGSRGVGKTTFLLNQIKDKNFLYFSADTPRVSSVSLYELVNDIFLQGYQGVVIDEVHFANNWSIHLKALFDDFPDRYIWISDSSNLMLRDGIGDLSRRFVQYKMPLLSFREFIYLKTGNEFPVIDIFEINQKKLNQYSEINFLKFFKQYLDEGMRPIFSEGEYCRRIKGMIEKTVYSDIPFHLKSIHDSHIRVINAIIGHLLYTSIPSINISKMCKEWGIGKEKLYEILYIMNESDLIKIVKQKNNKKYFTKGSKIFLNDPTLYHCYNGKLGNVREAFVTMIFSEKYDVFSSKIDKDYDFLINNIRFEVGGKNKKRKNADIVLQDNIEMPLKNKIPLWVAGTIY